MAPEILFEDNHIIVAVKQSGMLSQGDISGEVSLLDVLKLYIKNRYNKEGDAFVGLVHRLDMPVSGVMVFARTSKAARRLQSEIISGNMNKYYIAVVEKKLIVDDKWYSLENYLVREKDITRVLKKENNFTQKAELHYRTLLSSDDYSLVLIKLVTGRKHQIRAQFSTIGAPVAGDKKYGSRNELKNRICLHAVYLSFSHPTLKERLCFYSEIPDDFEKFLTFDRSDLKEIIPRLAESYKTQAFSSK